jgi:hypothetical protein
MVFVGKKNNPTNHWCPVQEIPNKNPLWKPTIFLYPQPDQRIPFCVPNTHSPETIDSATTLSFSCLGYRTIKKKHSFYDLLNFC